MNIIFLDIDNVLNYGYPFAKRSEMDTYGFANEFVDNLKYILDSVPYTRIVISSSWRLTKTMEIISIVRNWRNVLEEKLGCTKVGDLIIGDIPHTSEYPDSYRWTCSRGTDIKTWLELYSKNYKVENFVILDDNRSCGNIPTLYPDNFVNVDKFEVGECLSRRNADLAIEILKRKPQ